jgi:hypothetical protein
MGYPKEWIPRSRGADDESISSALENLASRGFVTDGIVNDDGVAYRQQLEQRTDELHQQAWKIFGEENTCSFLKLLEPISERFVDEINLTAGDNWMPAARPRRR